MSSAGCVQYPKHEHVTLPSVDSWGTNMNILRDPPKGIFTRRIDKVGETSSITKWIGEGAGDRICEAIKVYPRGIDPMKSVNYGNYGTSGGQVRFQAGNTNTNLGIQGSSFARTQQARLPHVVMRDGDFRPPVRPPQTLLPLSRLPRVWTSAFTNPEFPNFSANRMECPADDPKAIKKNVITTCVRPTAVYNIEVPTEKQYQVKCLIDNPLKVPAHSGIRTMDRTVQEVIEPTSGINYDLEYYGITANTGSKSTNKGNIESYGTNAERYTQDVSHSNVASNASRNINVTPIEHLSSVNIGLKDPLNSSYTAPISGQNGEVRIHNDHELSKKLPHYNARTNIQQNIYKKNVEPEELYLERRRPITSMTANRGDMRQDHNHNLSSRNHKLAPRLHRGGFINQGIKPRQHHIVNNLSNADPRKVRLQREAFKNWEDRRETY